MSPRAEIWTALDEDLNKLLKAFDAGRALTKEQGRVEYGIPERRFRAAVAKLREQGEPIVSWSEEGSTYRMAKDAQEAERFIESELLPRIRHLDRQVRNIRIGLAMKFKVTQTRLI